jgi:hypothetical protein
MSPSVIYIESDLAEDVTLREWRHAHTVRPHRGWLTRLRSTLHHA